MHCSISSRNRVAVVPLAPVGNSAAKAGRRIPRVEPNGLINLRYRCVEIALAEVDDPAANPSRRILRPAPEPPVDVCNRWAATYTGTWHRIRPIVTCGTAKRRKRRSILSSSDMANRRLDHRPFGSISTFKPSTHCLSSSV